MRIGLLICVAAVPGAAPPVWAWGLCRCPVACVERGVPMVTSVPAPASVAARLSVTEGHTGISLVSKRGLDWLSIDKALGCAGEPGRGKCMGRLGLATDLGRLHFGVFELSSSSVEPFFLKKKFGWHQKRVNNYFPHERMYLTEYTIFFNGKTWDALHLSCTWSCYLCLEHTCVFEILNFLNRESIWVYIAS